MAHLFVRRRNVHFHFIALLLMVAMVLVVMFTVRSHKPQRQYYDSPSPAGAVRR